MNSRCELSKKKCVPCRGGVPPLKGAALTELHRQLGGDWKVIEGSSKPAVNKNTHTELGNNPDPQLYNLASDPREQENLASKFPDRVQSMLAQLNDLRERGRSRP